MTVSVALAELLDTGVTVEMSNEVVIPLGDLLTAKATGELKLKMELTDTRVELDDPRATKMLDDAMPKSPAYVMNEKLLPDNEGPHSGPELPKQM
jgi:hypothetical protein